MGLGRRLAKACRVVGALAAASLTTAPAHADGDFRASYDLGRFLSEGAELLRSGSAGLLATGPAAKEGAGRGREGAQVMPILSPSLKLSLVARDWRGAQKITGGPLSVTDELRPSRSSRMVVTRLRVGDGRFVPFGQLGLGQWRVDPDLLPSLARAEELAAQVGGGFELHVARRGAIAVEGAWTAFYRERHEPDSLPTVSVLGVFAAARMEF